MKQSNTSIAKWVQIIQDRLKVWQSIDDQENVTKCEKLLEGWYMTSKHSNAMGIKPTSIIIQSKINFDR